MSDGISMNIVTQYSWKTAEDYGLPEQCNTNQCVCLFIQSSNNPGHCNPVTEQTRG